MFIFCRSISDIFDNVESSDAIDHSDRATHVEYLSNIWAFHLLLYSLKIKKSDTYCRHKKSSKINKI